jgi:hypothetical protein
MAPSDQQQRQPRRRALLLRLTAAAALLLAATPPASAQVDATKCGIPAVPGALQDATKPQDWGKCTSALEPTANAQDKHWCKFGRLGAWPDGPSPKAQTCLKFGRMSIFRGPMYGSHDGARTACNNPHSGSTNHATIAVSTKYLKTHQGGWQEDRGHCGKCMCVHIHGADNEYNTGLQKDNARAHMHYAFMGRVRDRCAECPDDQIDVLMDRPFSYAPFDPNNPASVREQRFAPYANARDNARVFGNPAEMRGTQFSPEAVGTWTADWQFVPCEWTHQRCVDMFKSVGYAQARAPRPSAGVDSYSLRPVSELRLASGSSLARTLFDKPWNLREGDEQ